MGGIKGLENYGIWRGGIKGDRNVNCLEVEKEKWRSGWDDFQVLMKNKVICGGLKICGVEERELRLYNVGD